MEFCIEALDKRKSADAIVLPYWEEDKKPLPAFSREMFDLELLTVLEKDFKGEPSEILFSHSKDSLEKRVILLGLGTKKSCNAEVLRKAFACLTELARKKKLKILNFIAPPDLSAENFSAILDGCSMANYSFDSLKRKTLEESPSSFLEKVFILGGNSSYQPLIERNNQIIASVNLTRDLVCGNADHVRAQDLALVAKNMANKYPAISCKILEKKELEKEQMGLLLAVSRGSDHDPALIILNYKGDEASKEVTAVVGKGITFDTGGLNLKPTGSIEDMKIDMSGASAVLGFLQAAASLKLKKNIIGVIAAAENAISSSSYKPGDVYISHSGRSVEITNTDAEGRLVLADALSYVQKYYQPSRIIDLATLTGGIVVALGEQAAGLFSNNELLTSQLKAASKKTGERVWEMPIYPEYKKALKSTIADMKNSAAGRKASPCTGAAFLSQFIENETPWAHLDIAGTAYISESVPYYPSFATGMGVKLLVEFVENL
jgi:leucyl aminopeptidase